MHGKAFLLDAIYAGIDEQNLYGRLDFVGGVPEGAFELVVTFDCCAPGQTLPGDGAPGGARSAAGRKCMRLEASVREGGLTRWRLRPVDSDIPVAASEMPCSSHVRATLLKNFEFQVPLAALGARFGEVARLRFTIWRDHLPVDALPVEGTLDLAIVAEEEMEAVTYTFSAHD
jgi:hypothetical protein